MKNKVMLPIAIIQLIIFIGVILFIYNYNAAMIFISSPHHQEQEKIGANQMFTQYGGEKVRGTVLQDLISKIILVNADNDDETPQITVNFDGKCKTGAEIEAIKIKLSATYKVDFTYKSGVVSEVIITSSDAVE